METLQLLQLSVYAIPFILGVIGLFIWYFTSKKTKVGAKLNTLANEVDKAETKKRLEELFDKAKLIKKTYSIAQRRKLREIKVIISTKFQFVEK
jgi:hypothetical protein